MVAHGEGRAQFVEGENSKAMIRYLGADGLPANSYQHNPNGSPEALTGFTSDDGRFNIMMPHPERLFRNAQFSYFPERDNEHGAWLRMFQNACLWLA